MRTLHWLLFATIGTASLLLLPLAYAQSITIPAPLAGCDSSATPSGQANPSDEPEPMGAIWCFPLSSGPTTRISGANDWVDDFATNVSMQTLGAVNLTSGNNRVDESVGADYRIFNNLTTGGNGALKTQGFINANHWMFDVSGAKIEGGTLMAPNRSFRWENGKLVVEVDYAAGMFEYGGADQFGEIDINTSPTVTVGKTPASLGVDCGRNITQFGQYAGTCKSPDALYGYGQFPGSWSLGCRLEAQANVICSIYNPTGDSVTNNDHPTGFGRVWEVSPIEVGEDIQVLQQTAGVLGHQQLWRRCMPNQMDMFCRDRFRIELTRTTLTLFVNGQLYFSFGVAPGHSISGIPQAGQLVPDELFNRPNYTYFTTWVSAFNRDQSVRFHWGRIAVNPHNGDGSIMAPSPAPSYCPGMVQNTCGAGMGNQPMPSMTTMPPMAAATASPTSMPAPAPASGGGGGSGSPRRSSSSSSSSPTSAPAIPNVFSAGGGASGGPAFGPLPVAPPAATPIPAPTPQIVDTPAAVEPVSSAAILRTKLSPSGGALVVGNLTLLVPPGGVSTSDAELVVTQVGTDLMPPLPSGLQAGDLAVAASLNDAVTGQVITQMAPPMTLTYAPSAEELVRTGGDLRRISLAVANGAGWEGLLCNPTGVTLTCSLPHLGVIGTVTAPSTSGPGDWNVLGGHFFAQRNGFGSTSSLGYSVLDDADAPMWSEFQRLGGVDTLGYPITRRFLYRGSIVQAFEKGVLQWMPDAGQVVLLNTLDELSAAGNDGWLNAQFQIPPTQDWSADRALAADDIAAGHLALLDAYPDVRDWLQFSGSIDVVGLPTAVQADGARLVVRFQRATLQYWLADTRLAPAGTAVVGSGAELGKQVGLWPSESMTPEAPPIAASP